MTISNALFSVGDVVRITDWEHDVSDMKHLVGLITSIRKIVIDGEGKYWYNLKDCSWHWREDWLEAVNNRESIEELL